MKIKLINKDAYSTIMVLFIIGFLLVLTTGIFNLILSDLKDNTGMWDYIKAYAWAESAQELALLAIKNKWYWYYDKIDHNINNRSVLLSEYPTNETLFKKNNDVFISYDLWWKVSEYNWELKSLEYDIIPLFIIDDNWNENKLDDIILTNISWNIWDLAWNIIWKNEWLTWTWVNTMWIKKTLVGWELKYAEQSMNWFIFNSDTNYLVLYNTWNPWTIEYKLTSWTSGWHFTSPETNIISSAQVWNYKQNLSTILDNTEYLNMLKYVIYSN